MAAIVCFRFLFARQHDIVCLPAIHHPAILLNMTPPRSTNSADLQGKVVESARLAGLERHLLETPLVVGVSGGADSLALLHILLTVRGSRASETLHVASLDHGFRGEAGAADVEFVRDIAGMWGLPFTSARFDVPAYAKARRLSLEDAARRARYTFLGSVAQSVSAMVAVAHNADDRVETVLMNILRGSGLSGLVGMKMLSALPLPGEDEQLATLRLQRMPASVMVFRPLLGIWHKEIEQYCAAEGLQPLVDASNKDIAFTRNRIRNRLIPLLEEQYSPATKTNLLNLSEIASQDDELLDDLVRHETEIAASISPDQNSVVFDRAYFATLPEAIRRRLIRWAFTRLAGTPNDFTFRHVQEVANILAGTEGAPKAADLPHDLSVRSRDGEIMMTRRIASAVTVPLSEPDTTTWPLTERHNEIELPEQGIIELTYGWILEIRLCEGQPGSGNDYAAMFDYDNLGKMGRIILRTRRPGDFIRQFGMHGKKTLQDLLVDAKIPMRVRDRIPIISISERGGEILWVPGPGGRRSIHALSGPNTLRVWRLEFRRTT